MVLEQDRAQREQSLRAQQSRAQRAAIQRNDDKRKKALDDEEAQEKKAVSSANKEKAAISAAYQKKVESITVPKLSLQKSKTHAQGKTLQKNPEYTKAVSALAAERDRALAAINIRESGVQVKRITLSRTASQVMRGEAKSGDYHVQYQVGVATANAELYSGKLSPTEYQSRLSKLSKSYRDAQGEFTRKNTPSAASLKTEGNVKVYSSIDTELKRLGGGGLGSGSGPTMVSGTLERSSPTISKRVPVAPGVAAKAQDFGTKFKQQQAQAIQTPTRLTPQQSFAAIATPGTSFGKVKPQTTIPASTKSVRNMVSPFIIPLSQRSNIGYSQQGKPIQGPLQQPQRYSVTDSSGKVRTFKDLETAQRFAGRTAKDAVTPVNIAGLIPPQQNRAPTPRLTPTSQVQHGVSKLLDNIAQFKTGNKYADSAYSAIVGHPIGSVRSVVEGVNVLDNLGKHEIPKYLGTPAPKGLEPIPIQRTGDEVILPIAIDGKGIRTKSAGEIKRDTLAYTKKYGAGDLVGGAVSTYVPIGLGIKAGAQTLGKIATKKVAPKLIRAATSEHKLIGSTPKITKTPMVAQQRIPNIGKETLLKQVKTTQQSVSGNPKLPKPYTPSPSTTIRTGIVPKENIGGKITLSKGFIPNKPSVPSKPLNANKPVSIDSSYTPARRAGEIDISDGALAGIRQTRVSLGVGITKTPTRITAPPRKPVGLDTSYTPSRRPNEIDLSDSKLAGIRQTRVSLGTGTGRTPSGGTPFKKLDFSNPRRPTPRKFDEPKIGKGDKLVGRGGTLQIVKAKSDIVKLKPKQTTPVKLKVRSESLAATPKVTSTKPVSFIVKPAGRIATRKKKPLRTTTAQPAVYETVYRQRLPVKAAGIASMIGVPSMLSMTANAQLVAPKVSSSSRLKSPLKPISISKAKQPTATKQSSAQKPQLKLSQPSRSVPRQRAQLRTPPKFRQQLRTQQPMKPTPRRKVVGALPFFDSDDRKRKKKGEKRADFLGNVRLGSIVGFVKRSDITYGRKKIDKFIRKDPSVRGKRQKGARVFG